MLIHLLVLLLLPIPFFAELDGPGNNECNLCQYMGTHLKFSAHLTVSSEGQNEPEMLMPDGALISIDCSNPSKTIQKVLVLWMPPDDPTTKITPVTPENTETPVTSVTSSKRFLDNSAFFTTEPTSTTETSSKSTMEATSEEITSTYSTRTRTTDLTTPTDTTTKEKSSVETKTDLTTFTTTSTFHPSSTTELTKETELHSSVSTSTEVSTNVMTKSEEIFPIVPEDSKSGPGTAILGPNSVRVLNNSRSKRGAEPVVNPTGTNELIFYFKQTNLTYFLNRVFISFRLDKLGIQYYADLSGLRLWVTPNGYAYECPGGENFTLHENSILTLKNIKIAAFIQNSCRYPETPSFTCGSPLPEADMTNGGDPSINGVLIAGIAMGSLSLMGVAIIAFRRCFTWLRAPKPRPLTL
ncbi:uncharacterized protein LOC113203182 isoform X3 [Frankliniella occidentalis]|uniref:Uncharacterized protein LOC113203182 isoform X3 n=1 Tax=Frankliniella occidentalis TaxID=133901 RepID=A0A9C6UDY4_FRAOC|nr:uncharacterized protein LOC113203182 isoform X3 [Frankliniella occidentalis]